jgi:EAL domain-containing protein (putative c-di-GMP-specific phosphodiesterase class I)
VTAVEGLVRWPHPRLGLLQPAAFLDICEHTNLIKPLTQLVLEQSLAQVNQWAALGLNLSVAVNVSTGLLVDHHFVDTVMQALDQTGTRSSQLKLEVTESSLMSQPEVTREILQELARLGITIVIDDFGTGYSSLAYLADLPVSEVKIDRSLVSSMTTRSKTSIIVNSTIDLAHHLGLRAVAEGVEDSRLLQHLSAIGCDIAQGFVIARPMPSDNVEGWLARATDIPLLEPRAASLLDRNQERVLA